MLRIYGAATSTSLRANGSRECAPDDGLREAIHRPRRHCERSEAIHLAAQRKNGLLRCARNDGEFVGWVEPRETHHLHRMMGIAEFIIGRAFTRPGGSAHPARYFAAALRISIGVAP